MKAAGEEIACAGGDEEAGRVPCSVNDSLTTIPTLAPPQCLLGGNTSALHVQGHATRDTASPGSQYQGIQACSTR